MEQGKTVEETCKCLEEDFDGIFSGLYGFDKYYIAGNKDLTF